LLSPNAFFDVTDVLDRKREMIAIHTTQGRAPPITRKYAEALARTRAFLHPVREDRSGAVDAYWRCRAQTTIVKRRISASCKATFDRSLICRYNVIICAEMLYYIMESDAGRVCA
jgi:hypothetical protein